MTYHYKGTILVDHIYVDVEAEAEGFYVEGDSFGYGCEPPDEDFNITEVNIKKAYHDDPDDPDDAVEITDELKMKVKHELYSEDFEED